MSVLYVLILISGVIASAFLIGFIWSVKSGQYDDTYSPSVRMLFQDHKHSKSKGDIQDQDSSSQQFPENEEQPKP